MVSEKLIGQGDCEDEKPPPLVHDDVNKPDALATNSEEPCLRVQLSDQMGVYKGQKAENVW